MVEESFLAGDPEAIIIAENAGVEAAYFYDFRLLQQAPDPRRPPLISIMMAVNSTQILVHCIGWNQQKRRVLCLSCSSAIPTTLSHHIRCRR